MLLGKKADRGRWAEGIDVKDLAHEKAEVLYHAGCRYSFDENLWPIARAGIDLLQRAGVDVGIAGREETCCGGRAYEMGYQSELTKYAEHNLDIWKTAGVKTVVTPCADCYHAFKVLYNKTGKNPRIEVLHITEYIERLIKEGRLKPSREVPITATYHDPCHLGRLGEEWIHWEGTETKVLGQLIGQDPPKEFRRGAGGVYDPPREILRSIPGLEFVEMYRIREYAWCCGAGGGVIDAFPDFAVWAAEQRLKEAESVGAEAIVTACPWCVAVFNEAAEKGSHRMKVYDIVELLHHSLS